MSKLTISLVLFFLATPAAAQDLCEQVRVRSPQQTQLVQTVPRFSARKILDLDFQVVFPGSFRGEHTVHVELTTPNGHLYQKLDVPVADSTASKRTRVMAGYRRPLRVRQLQSFDLQGVAKRVARVAFPVAGTSILKSGLYGRWTVTIFVDDAKEPCTSATFYLTD